MDDANGASISDAASLPRITIVTPSYNQAKFLRETIESILGQGYANLEYIIIDGGSTDGSVDIIKEYEGALTYWVSEEDRGQSHAIMKGLERCTGEIFAWVNSDDMLWPGCLEAVAKCYMKTNKPDIVHANVVYVDADGRVTRFIRVRRQSRFFVFRGVWSGTAPAVFFKSSSFRKVGGVDERYYQAMDMDVWLRLMKAGARVSHVPRYLGGFRWHDNSKSHETYFGPGAQLEHSEVIEIFGEGLSRSSVLSRFIWRCIWKCYQVVNLNYVRAYVDRRRLGVSRHWKEVASRLS